MLKMKSLFLVVKPSKITFLIENTIPQREDRILLYNGYRSLLQKNYSDEERLNLGKVRARTNCHPMCNDVLDTVST